MGAEGQVLNYAADYAGIMLAGAGFQIFATGCVPLLRNYDAPVLAMMSMIAGFSTNIVLDWLFVSRLSLGVAAPPGPAFWDRQSPCSPACFFCAGFFLSGICTFYVHVLTGAKMIFLIGLSPMGLTLCQSGTDDAQQSLRCLGRSRSCCRLRRYRLCHHGHLPSPAGCRRRGTQPLISFYRGWAKPKRQNSCALWLTGLHCAFESASAGRAALSDSCVFWSFHGSRSPYRPHASALFHWRRLPLLLPDSHFLFYSIRRNSLAYILVYGELVFLWDLPSDPPPLPGNRRSLVLCSCFSL